MQSLRRVNAALDATLKIFTANVTLGRRPVSNTQPEPDRRLSYKSLDGIDLEVKADQREHETLEILDQIVEGSKALRISVGCTQCHTHIHTINS